MAGDAGKSEEIFSFHLAKLPLFKLPYFLGCPTDKTKVSGLRHAESFVTMNLGAPILAASRFNLKTVALFAWWNEETSLSSYLERPSSRFIREGWHVRMRLYRRWGEISEIKEAVVREDLAIAEKPVVAVTLARLRLSETARFARWGRPVETQVRNHPGKTLALAAIRPLNTFSTFSIWQNEPQMLGMVSGKDRSHDGEDHRLAMRERIRKDFHHEFTTLRFVPFRESGIWNGKSDYTA